MNREINDYYELPVKNVFFGQDKGKPVDTQYARDLHPFMKPLIEMVAKRNPAWAFNAYGANIRGRVIVYSYFDVYIGRDKLGTISLGYRAGNDTYEIKSPALIANSRRRRRDHVQSADIKKAAKLVAEHIKPETQALKVSKARTALDQLIAGKKAGADVEAARDQRNLWPFICSLLATEWDTIEPKLRALNAPQTTLDRFIPHLHTLDDAMKLTTKVNNNRGAYILLDDNGNYVVREGDYINVLTSSDLTADMRTKLGMLKLCADDTVMPDIGARLNDRTFYITEAE